MSIAPDRHLAETIDYPDSDGQPMSDNTLQWQWMVTIKDNLEELFADREDVFVAGDLLWYPREGSSTTRSAPDVMVAFGRPKGYRDSYIQWREGGIAPQVVFEILSPGNRVPEMLSKLRFCEEHGVEEYYVYDPATFDLVVMQRQGDRLIGVDRVTGWVSPRLGIRFSFGPDGLTLLHPDGRPFRTFVALAQETKQLRQRADRMAARLRALGIDPEEA